MGVEFYAGADKLGVGNQDTQPERPSLADGGPVKTFEGGYEGKGVAGASATKNYYAQDSAPRGDVIDGPVSKQF